MQILQDNKIYYWLRKYDLRPMVLEYLQTKLSNVELGASSKYSSSIDASMYIFRRGMLKEILSCIIGVNVSSIQILLTEFGKPFLNKKDFSASVNFNCSSSEDYVLYAFTTSNDVGCDIIYNMYGNDLNIKEDEIFSSGDIQLIHRGVDRKYEISKLWTKKEALLKCVGTGFSQLKLDSIDLGGGEIMLNSLDNIKANKYFMFTSDILKNYTFSIAANADSCKSLSVEELVYENEIMF